MRTFYVILGIAGILITILLFSMGGEEAVQTSREETPQMSGVHIMADGTVMDGMGRPIPNAVIQSDGNIRLEDGKVYIPSADFRN